MDGKQRILVVDDTPTNIKILNETLRDEYAISVATNGKDALALARSENAPDLILLDIMMPDMDGYEVCRQLKEDPATQAIPVLFVTAMGEVANEERGLSLGAVDYITKPFSPPIVKARVHNHMQLKLYRDHLEDLVAQRTRELTQTQDVTIHSLTSLAETRDNETGGHIRRTQHYVKVLAERLRQNPKFAGALDAVTVDLLYKSSPLHDVGKVGVRDHILLKPGKLTVEEHAEMKKHTTYGRDAILYAEDQLEDNSFLHLAHEIAHTHHEKWDGSGYPRGLKGVEIPLPGRIMAIADIYDALVSKRIYKPPLPHSRAVEIITEGRGTFFDPDITDAFLEIHNEFRRIASQFADYAEETESLAR